MGANTIRTYNVMNSAGSSSYVLAALDAAHAHGLYVIMGYSMPTFQTFAQSSSTVQSEVLASVALYKNHPAVLMWVLGNEVNLTCPEGGDCTWSSNSWYNFVNQLAGQVKAIDPNHPVATSEGEIPNVWGYNIGNAANNVQGDDAHMTNLDLWGINCYRGTSFGTLFTTTVASTTKPVLITEFGKDAYKDSAGAENQAMQASHLSSLWQEITANLSAVLTGKAIVGGVVFEWTDEWWKDSGSGASCLTHDKNILFTRPADTEDPGFNDEWFGLAAVLPIDAITNPAGTLRLLRQSYGTMKALWNVGSSGSSNNNAGAASFFTDTVHNYPNPFRAGAEPTKFVIFLNEGGTVEIRIFDAAGQRVVELPTISPSSGGRFEVVWDGRTSQGDYVSPGLYVARINGHSADHNEHQFRRVVAVR